MSRSMKAQDKVGVETEVEESTPRTQMMRVEVELVGKSPYSPSRPVQSVKSTGETDDKFEQRTWRERINADENGMAFIPPMAFKNCLSDVAIFLSEKVPGKGKATYTKHFQAGVLVIDPLPLGVKASDIPGERLFVPSNGRRGSGSRVWKTFPTLPGWRTKATFFVLDPVLMDKPEKVEEYIRHAGKFIGMGRFRPRNNGYYGRFEIEKFSTFKENVA